MSLQHGCHAVVEKGPLSELLLKLHLPAAANYMNIANQAVNRVTMPPAKQLVSAAMKAPNGPDMLLGCPPHDWHS